MPADWRWYSRAMPPISRNAVVRRRDRRGRGLRGPVFPPVIPAHRTRAERFDEAVLDSVAYLKPNWETELAKIEFAVEDVPPSDPAPWEVDAVPLGRCFAPDSGLNTRIVLYRRPIEARLTNQSDLPLFVHEILVEQLAQHLNKRPGEIDPKLDDDD